MPFETKKLSYRVSIFLFPYWLFIQCAVTPWQRWGFYTGRNLQCKPCPFIYTQKKRRCPSIVWTYQNGASSRRCHSPRLSINRGRFRAARAHSGRRPDSRPIPDRLPNHCRQSPTHCRRFPPRSEIPGRLPTHCRRFRRICHDSSRFRPIFTDFRPIAADACRRTRNQAI
jgi:hypothetical protein